MRTVFRKKSRKSRKHLEKIQNTSVINLEMDIGLKRNDQEGRLKYFNFILTFDKFIH